MRPIEFVYKQHPWRKPKKGSEAGWIISQFLGEFHSHDFVRVYRQHLAASGRPFPTDRALASKLWYHFEKGYIIRRGFWNNDWKEWRNGREVEVQFLQPREQQQEQEQEALNSQIEGLLAEIPDRSEQQQQQQEEPREEFDPTEDVLRKIGY